MSRLRALAVAALTLAATARGVAAQHDLVTLPLFDPVYTQLAGLARLGCRAAHVSPYRPYATTDVRSAVAEMANEPRCEGMIVDELRRRFGPRSAADSAAILAFGAALEVRATALRSGEFRPLWADARPTGDGAPPVVGVLRGRVTWEASRDLVVVSEAYAQNDTRNDPRTRGQPLREGSGVFDFGEAYINGRLGPLILSFGRSQEAWLGRGEESLILSAHGPAIDRLSAMARWSQWEARAVVASLDRVSLDPATDGPFLLEPETVHRLLAGHALSYAPTEWVQVTLGETVLIGRLGRTADLALVNPFIPYLVTQNDQDRDDDGDEYNVIAFGAARFTVGSGTIEAELHIDDIQIDESDREHIPDQLAWRIAGTTRLPLRVPSSLNLEYRRIDSYTYSRGVFNQVYQRYGAPIGSELGPDADLLRGDAEAWLSGVVRMGVSVGRWRRGAQRIDARPSVAAEGNAGGPFPSVTTERPAVQSAWLLELTAAHLGTRLPVELRVEVANLDNVENRPDSPATYARVSLVGTYRFRYP